MDKKNMDVKTSSQGKSWRIVWVFYHFMGLALKGLNWTEWKGKKLQKFHSLFYFDVIRQRIFIKIANIEKSSIRKETA